MEQDTIISIVIANYNYGRFLADAITSIVTQKGFERCELIVVDGGSTDDSIDVIHHYEDKIAWWVSERDRGQSDAFNKGFRRARGKYLTWVNADDVLINGTINSVLQFLEKHPEAEWISGGILYFDEANEVVKARIGAQPPAFAYNWLDMTVVGGPSSFFSRECFEKAGGFDETMHYAMDIDLWRRFAQARMKLFHLNRYFWGFRLHSDSKTASTVVAGRYSDGHRKEVVRMERQISSFSPLWKRRLGMRAWRVYKAINGSLLRSVYDTVRFRGRMLNDLFL